MLPVAALIFSLLLSSSARSFASSASGSHMMSGSASGSEDTITTVIHVMAVLPVAANGLESGHRWKRGEEILPGAVLALKEIHESDNLLSGYQLELLPVEISSCDFVRGVVPFIRELTSSQNHVVGIVGYFCHNIKQHFSYVIQHEPIGALQLSAIATQEEDCSSCPQHSILPLTEISARAVVKLMQRLEWNRVAVICNKDLSYAKQVFYKSAKEQGINVPIELEVPLVKFEIARQFLEELLLFSVRIIVAFVSPSEAIELICTAQHHNFKWPDYAWIFMEIDVYEIPIASELCAQQAAAVIMNHSIFIHTLLKTNRTEHLPSGLNYSAYYDSYLRQLEKSSDSTEMSVSSTLQSSNLYANVLYDSIWAISLALNRSLSILEERNLSPIIFSHRKTEIRDILEEQLSEVSFQGATGFLNFSQGAATVVTSVELFQQQNGKPEIIGVYNATLDDLNLDVNKLGEIPSTTLALRYVLFPIWLTVILTTIAGICLVLTIISMCVFFYHRRQPAIKATSSTLSICMFIGCYFLLTSSLFHTVNSGISKHRSGEPLRGFICSFDVFLFNIGFDIVFATVIAKTLRLYFIFRPFGRAGRICSDQGLFMFILIIISVKLTLLILWTGIDINHLIDIEQYVTTSVPPYFIVIQQCQCRYLELWIGVHSSYSIILLLIMVTLAIMTRKIKRDHFNDTKKINTLTAVLLFHMIISLSLWLLLRQIEATVLSKVMYTLSTMLTAVFCQVYLILPKIVPLLLGRGKHGRSKAAPHRQFSVMSFLSTDADIMLTTQSVL